MATGIEGWLQSMIQDGHHKFMFTSEFWAKVARDYGNSKHVNIETIIGKDTKVLD